MLHQWIVVENRNKTNDLPNEKRQPCEVWTRVMGYHRPVSSFNIGKKAEHQERKFFREEKISYME